MEAAIWGLLGTLVGAIASIATTWMANHSTYKLQLEKARDERAVRASAFQRETLLELQEAVHDALRLINRAHIEDSKAHQATKEWGKNMLSDDINEGVRLAQRRVSILVERVADDHLRSIVNNMSKDATRVLLARSGQEAQLYMNQTAENAEKVFAATGTVLRQHY
jgi:Arc/MetJ family transcription regulator